MCLFFFDETLFSRLFLITLRRMHPTFDQAGRVISQAFRPTPNDEDRLSTDDGDSISSEDSWQRFNSSSGCSSCGVMAVTVGECGALERPIDPDGTLHPEHVSILFEGL